MNFLCLLTPWRFFESYLGSKKNQRCIRFSIVLGGVVLDGVVSGFQCINFVLTRQKFGKYAIFIWAGYFDLWAGNLPPPPALEGRCPKKLASDHASWRGVYQNSHYAK